MSGSKRRGPAPIASFDHDMSDEVKQPSSPESKQMFTLPEIREQAAEPSTSAEPAAAVAGTSGDAAGVLTGAVAAPRIDISRASSSSHQDSRDSSPEEEPRALGFREDGAADLRSSTEELAFLEGAPAAPPPPAVPAASPAAAPAPRRHSRKDSQGSEAALLLVSGRTSRLSSIGSACSAQSHVSRLSAVSGVSGVSRSPSPHKMLLETSFCGPKPIESDPDVCTAIVEERLLQLEKKLSPVTAPPEAVGAVDARDRREVRIEVTVEPERPDTRPAPQPAPVITNATEKQEKETRNQAQVEERRSRPRKRRDGSQPEVYKSSNRSKDIIRIKLKPDDEDDDDETEEESEVRGRSKGAQATRPTELGREAGGARRSPSPSPVTAVSRKSSFCSLFKSREAVNSPESPGGARRRSRSGEGRRSLGVLALFRRGGDSPAPSLPAATSTPLPAPHLPPPPHAEKLKYYEPARDGIIHIPLRSPPADAALPTLPAVAGPSSAPPLARTVLPDGSILIPLRSPPERAPPPLSAGHSPPPTAPRPTDRPRPESAPARSAMEQQHAVPPAPPAPSPAICATSSSSPSPQTPPLPAPASPPPPASSPPPPASSAAAPSSSTSRRTRLVFSTHVGSAEQVFSTQLSLTQTPSVTSDLSESQFPEMEAPLEAPLRDTHIGPSPEPPAEDPPSAASSSSGSAGVPTASWEPEQRGLVVQESFEDELPYVPTTLPQERSVVVPMVPVRARTHHTTASVERPRGSAPVPRAPPPRALPAPPAPPAPSPAPTAAGKLLIRLPLRPKTPAQEATVTTPTAPEVSDPARVPHPEWVAFEESGRRPPARRIQTVAPPAPPAPAAPAPPRRRQYAPPDRCRCECHHQHTHTTETDAQEESSAEEGEAEGEEGAGEPFTGDLQLSADTHTHAQTIMHPASSPPQ